MSWDTILFGGSNSIWSAWVKFLKSIGFEENKAKNLVALIMSDPRISLKWFGKKKGEGSVYELFKDIEEALDEMKNYYIFRIKDKLKKIAYEELMKKGLREIVYEFMKKEQDLSRKPIEREATQDLKVRPIMYLANSAIEYVKNLRTGILELELLEKLKLESRKKRLKIEIVLVDKDGKEYKPSEAPPGAYDLLIRAKDITINDELMLI